MIVNGKNILLYRCTACSISIYALNNKLTTWFFIKSTPCWEWVAGKNVQKAKNHTVMYVHRIKSRTWSNFWYYQNCILVNHPPCAGISRMDWVSCAGDINLLHTRIPPAWSPPNKKIRHNKILTHILRSIFLEIPHLELPRWQKTPRDTNGKGVSMISGYWSVWHLYR
jgi:hypothetical protein